MMKKKLSLLLAILMLAVILTGCGASAKSEAMNDSMVVAPSAPMMPAPAPAPAPAEPMAPGASADDYYDYAADVKGDAPEVTVPEIETGSGTSLPVGVKLIYRAHINLESTAFDTAVNTIQSLTTSCGGYFENSGLDNYGNYRYAYYTVRVPAAQFETFCSTISQIGESGETFQVRNISRSAEDVSEVYYDTEARLTTQKTKLARLQDLLSRAESMEDIITIESAISETEFAIENLTGTLRHYDSLVGYSTINIDLSEVYKLTEVEEPVIGFGAKLVAAFKSGCSRFVNNLERTLLNIARSWVGWLIFLVIAAIVIVVLVRFSRRCKVRRAERKAARDMRRGKSAPEMPAPRDDTKEN